MEHSYLGELADIAFRIIELEAIENQLDSRQRKQAKREYDSAKEKFADVRSQYVNALLSRDIPNEEVVAEVEELLADLRQHADPSWHPAIKYVHENVMPAITKESSKSPRRRKIEKAAPWVIGGLVVVAYFGVKLFSATPVTAELESREGLVQRASAIEKVITYDKWMGTHVRRGGWLKGILLWPIESSEDEIQGAAQFAGLVIQGQEYVDGCGSVIDTGENLSDEQIKMIGEVAEYIQRGDITWDEPAVQTVLDGLQEASAC